MPSADSLKLEESKSVNTYKGLNVVDVGVNSSLSEDGFSRHCSRGQLKTLLPKEILLNLSNISFGNYVFSFKLCIYFNFENHFEIILIFWKVVYWIQNGCGCWRVKIYTFMLNRN